MKKLAVGIDIGGTNTAIGLIDSTGNMYGETVIPTKNFPDFDLYVEEVYMSIQNLEKNVKDDVEIIGIGVGAPNANYYHGTIEEAPNLVWKGTVHFVDRMKRFFPNIVVKITNDANAAAIGEMIYGGAKGMKNFIEVTLGTGLGSGFVANGQLIYGHDSFAGELGHTTVDFSEHARVCGCGKKGCLETYVSATGIKRTVFQLLAERTAYTKFRDISFNDFVAEMVSNGAHDGDPVAREAFEYTGMILGRALADAVAITSPEAIFLFGGLAKAGELIFEPTKRHMEANLLPIFRNRVKVLPSGIDDKNAAILGASALIWDTLQGN